MTIKLPLPADLTHYEALLCMWLGLDPPLLAAARERAHGEETEYGDDDLAAWLGDLLYDPAYRVTGLKDLVWVDAEGGNVEVARAVRASIPEDKFNDIDNDGWARIRTALLAGTEEA